MVMAGNTNFDIANVSEFVSYQNETSLFFPIFEILSIFSIFSYQFLLSFSLLSYPK